MPYCKECGYEYTEGKTRCPDCEATLEQGERFVCDSCTEQVPEDAVFCPHCGIVLSWVDMEVRPIHCDIHRDNEVVGCCVICRKALCAECAVRKFGRTYCTNDEHVKTAFNWVAACTTGTSYEAEMIKANLEGAGIPALVLSQSDRMNVATIGDLAVTEVMVPIQSLDEAQRFLRAVEGEAVGEVSP